jgi:hypothetical protein
MSPRRSRRTLQALSLALLAASTVACSDDELVSSEPEPQVATMRLTVNTTAGTSTVNVSENGTVTGGPLLIANNGTLTAQFLRADGTPDPIAAGFEFELRMTPAAPANLTFTRTGQFAGTLTVTGLASNATTTAQFALFHIAETHEDFGPFPVTMRVR